MSKSFMFLVLTNLLSAQSIFVTPNKYGCPTNKIAPQRRVVAEYRTLGYFQDLFLDDVADRPSRPQAGYNCDEETQNDDSDETAQNDNDVANDTSGPRFFPTNRLFGNFFPSNNNHHRPPRPQQPVYIPGSGNVQQPVRPSRRPTQPPANPTRPPTRPPYHSGGQLVNRPHVLPRPEYPSNSVKPVYEQVDDRPAAPWIPGIVGGPSGDVIGARPAFNRYPNSPNSYQNYKANPTNQDPQKQLYYQNTQNLQNNRAPRKYNKGSNSILGSFIDLLFK